MLRPLRENFHPSSAISEKGYDMTDTPQIAEFKATLQKEIKAAHDARKIPLVTEDVAGIVNQVIHALAQSVPSEEVKFYAELEELARYIRQAKHDIASIKPKDISTDYIPTATDELDAVVGATEEATNKIMDVCDEMSKIAETCSEEAKNGLIACTTKIFEACNFQDITGQRITKVVETLKHIDSKVEALVRAMGEEFHRAEGTGNPKHVHAGDPEKGLLNGPQLPQNAINQDEIDRLLSGQ
jgi:chemotaxis protein CheZ